MIAYHGLRMISERLRNLLLTSALKVEQTMLLLEQTRELIQQSWPKIPIKMRTSNASPSDAAVVQPIEARITSAQLIRPNPTSS
jgi:hypothetical protein